MRARAHREGMNTSHNNSLVQPEIATRWIQVCVCVHTDEYLHNSNTHSCNSVWDQQAQLLLADPVCPHLSQRACRDAHFSKLWNCWSVVCTVSTDSESGSSLSEIITFLYITEMLLQTLSWTSSKGAIVIYNKNMHLKCANNLEDTMCKIWGRQPLKGLNHGFSRSVVSSSWERDPGGGASQTQTHNLP